jgi:uncharacterized protein YrrD
VKILKEIAKNNTFRINGFLKFITNSVEIIKANNEILAKTLDKISSIILKNKCNISFFAQKHGVSQ